MNGGPLSCQFFLSPQHVVSVGTFVNRLIGRYNHPDGDHRMP